jgi:hypothetical protein
MNSVESRVLYFEPSPNCHRQRQQRTIFKEATSRVKVEIKLLKMETLEDVGGFHARGFPAHSNKSMRKTRQSFASIFDLQIKLHLYLERLSPFPLDLKSPPFARVEVL